MQYNPKNLAKMFKTKIREYLTQPSLICKNLEHFVLGFNSSITLYVILKIFLFINLNYLLVIVYFHF